MTKNNKYTCSLLIVNHSSKVIDFLSCIKKIKVNSDKKNDFSILGAKGNLYEYYTTNCI